MSNALTENLSLKFTSSSSNYHTGMPFDILMLPRNITIGGSSSSGGDEEAGYHFTMTEFSDVNRTVFDPEALLTEKFGPRYKGLAEACVLTLMYCIIFVTGVIGNVCTCVVIVRNVDMHTVTNCYLFSLAVSDTLTLIFGKFCITG